MLPQLVCLAAIGIGFAFASRWVNREVARVDFQMRRLQRILLAVSRNRIPQLQLDEASGVYLPVKY